MLRDRLGNGFQTRMGKVTHYRLGITEGFEETFSSKKGFKESLQRLMDHLFGTKCYCSSNVTQQNACFLQYLRSLVQDLSLKRELHRFHQFLNWENLKSSRRAWSNLTLLLITLNYVYDFACLFHGRNSLAPITCYEFQLELINGLLWVSLRTRIILLSFPIT